MANKDCQVLFFVGQRLRVTAPPGRVLVDDDGLEIPLFVPTAVGEIDDSGYIGDDETPLDPRYVKCLADLELSNRQQPQLAETPPRDTTSIPVGETSDDEELPSS